MIERGSVLPEEEHAFIGLAGAKVDIERICQRGSDKGMPPEAFLVSSVSMGNSLLAVRLGFLEDGQLLACPGLPLVGAAFNPDWGFARTEIELHPDDRSEFRVPHGHPDTFTNGDTWGYRLCPVDNQEIPDVIRQLARIRADLAGLGKRPRGEMRIRASVTEL